MNIGATSLSLPTTDKVFLSNNFDSIDIMHRQLADDEFRKIADADVCDSMMSLLDSPPSEDVSLSQTEKTFLDNLLTAISDGVQHNIYKFVFGSPAWRAKFDYSDAATIKLFSQLNKNWNQFNALHKLTTREIVFYIENIDNDNNEWLSNYAENVGLIKTLNKTLSSMTAKHIIFRPLYDSHLINFQASNEDVAKIATYVSHTTDRVHINQLDVKNSEWSDTNVTLENFIASLITSNNNKLTLTYEYRQPSAKEDYNNSALSYAKDVRCLIAKYAGVYDTVVIGNGIYGQKAAQLMSEYGRTLIVDKFDIEEHIEQKTPYNAASLINQARVHQGYHYPRSKKTAVQSKSNFRQFVHDFKPAIISDFMQVYAIPKYGSLTSAEQYWKFCKALDLPIEKYYPSILKSDHLNGSFLTKEYAVDTKMMMKIMSSKSSSIEKKIGNLIKISSNTNDKYDFSGFTLHFDDNSTIRTRKIINCTYAATNKVEDMLDLSNELSAEKTSIKYQLCEIALFEQLDAHMSTPIGVTLMDGPFNSFMPFAKSKNRVWSLTSVIDTPHQSMFFDNAFDLSQMHVKSSVNTMLKKLSLYVDEDYLDKFKYIGSKYVIKALPIDAANDDNRSIHLNLSLVPGFYSILGGKLDAIYDLDSIFKRNHLYTYRYITTEKVG